MAALPYVTTPGNIDKALQNIKAAATPQSVNQDFVKTILKIPGGSGNQMAAFLRKVGFVRPDGSPSDIYTRFRNDASAGRAAVDALKIGYAPLAVRNEYWYALTDDKLRGLIVEETGSAKDASMVGMILACIKAIRKHADFDAAAEPEITAPSAPAMPVPHMNPPQLPPPEAQTVGLRLGYNINLNLPATSDIAVFNAIFKSLRENLLKATDEN
jgi:hypothetical protein